MSTQQSELSPKRMSKRQAIIEAAINVFARKGYLKAKISEVAEKANVADGTVYLYFKNKDDLLIHAMREMMEDKLSKIRRKIAKEKTAWDKLFKFAELHIELYTKNPEVARFMVVEIRQSQEFYKKYPTFAPLNEYVDYVQALVNDAITEGSIRKIDSKTLALMIIGTMDFVLTQWVLGIEDISLQDVTNNFIEIVHSGLRMN
jgi:TetR/AcrR family transcriptional regulator, fatty acid metabolism regulator protein